MVGLKNIIKSVFAMVIFGVAFNVHSTTFESQDPVFDPKADKFVGFIEIRANKSLYVDYVKAQPGNPTVILLNGLTYSTRQWTDFSIGLIKKGIGVVRFDFDGMGKTMERYAPYSEAIPVESQATDIKLLMRKMQIAAPFNLVGLSYGGGVAAEFALLYPKDVKNLILMAPFTQPVEGQDTWIKAQIWATRQIFPWNTMTDDELYDYYLHQIIYATYPQAEPIVLESPWKLETIFRLIQGIRKFKALDSVNTLPKKTVHLMVAGQDQYINRSVMDDYWDAIPHSARASKIIINNSEHKIPEAVPLFSSAWVYEIVTGNALLFKGKEFVGYPFAGRAESKDETINVKND